MGQALTRNIEGDSDTPGEELGPLLRRLRDRKQAQGKEVAVKLGISPSALTQWEKGTRKPADLSRLLRLLDLLEAGEQEREQVLSQAGFDPRLASIALVGRKFSNLPDLLAWLDVKLAKISSLQEEITEQIADIQEAVTWGRSIAPLSQSKSVDAESSSPLTWRGSA